MIKTRFWVMGIFAVLGISIAATAGLSAGSGGTIAKIYLEGVCIRTVDLSAVSEPYTFTVKGNAGVNTIEVAHGKIRIKEADCPDQICVHRGWASGSGTPIVCLPNRLVIRIAVPRNAEQPDGMSS